MKKIIFLAAMAVLLAAAPCFAQSGNLLIDDFEGTISGGPEGTVDFGAGNGSDVQVSASTDIRNTGDQSLKVIYDAQPGGYMYIARGWGLDAQNANWILRPEDIEWTEYKAVSFYMYGTGSNAEIAFDVKDDSGELWRFVVQDDFTGWKQIVCDFDKFMVRDDWQPDAADKNGQLDFPINIFQFEPLPESKGTLYFDTVELIKR